MDEAVIEELTIRFDRRFFVSIPALKKELARREVVRQNLGKDGGEIAGAVASELENGMWSTTAYAYEYKKARRELWSLIREIFSRNRTEFTSQEDVFRLFAEAVLTGRLTQLAKVIERAFGKGAFRELGEKTGIQAEEPTS